MRSCEGGGLNHRYGCVSHLVVESSGVQIWETQCRAKLLKRNAGRVSSRFMVSLKCNWARCTYFVTWKGGIPVSTGSPVWSPYTCRTLAKDRLRLVCILCMSVLLWIYRKF